MFARPYMQSDAKSAERLSPRPSSANNSNAIPGTSTAATSSISPASSPRNQLHRPPSATSRTAQIIRSVPDASISILSTLPVEPVLKQVYSSSAEGEMPMPMTGWDVNRVRDGDAPGRPHTARKRSATSTNAIGTSTSFMPAPPTNAAAKSSSANAATPRRPHSARTGNNNNDNFTAPTTARPLSAMSTSSSPYLHALTLRHAYEHDRLTLYNRIQHLHSTQERIVKANEKMEEEMTRLETIRNRHEQQMKMREMREKECENTRIQYTSQLRELSTTRRTAYAQYRAECVRLKQLEAAKQRAASSQRLLIRETQQREQTTRVQSIRAQLHTNSAVLQHRLTSEKEYKRLMLHREKQRKYDAELKRSYEALEDLRALEKEEKELMEKTRMMQEEQMRMRERLEETINERPVSPSKSMIREEKEVDGERKEEDPAAAEAAATSPSRTGSSHSTRPTSAHPPGPHFSTSAHQSFTSPTPLDLSLPSKELQNRINQPSFISANRSARSSTKQNQRSLTRDDNAANSKQRDRDEEKEEQSGMIQSPVHPLSETAAGSSMMSPWEAAEMGAH